MILKERKRKLLDGTITFSACNENHFDSFKIMSISKFHVVPETTIASDQADENTPLLLLAFTW